MLRRRDVQRHLARVDYMIVIGELSLWVAVLMAAWCSVVSVVGGVQGRQDLIASGERAIYATFGFTLLASLGLWTALVSHDFSLRFVASYTSINVPTLYALTAFWAGQAGSMLFWALILSMVSAIAVVSNRNANRTLMPWVTGTLGVLCLFFLMTLAIGANPYERLDWTPPDGRGMNPQLQNPGMAIHPPMLYLGLVATAVPFAFAIGSLVSRTFDAEWLGAVRRWALVSWFFLTIGIVLGMRWSYVELGWGGYWAWDAVENSSLLPWLTGTAFLHSIIIQEKRGVLRTWNVTLVVVTFLLSMLGMFIARSGVVESLHAYAQSPVGNWYLGLLILATIATAYLVRTRLRDLQGKGELERTVSREAALLSNTLVLVGICFSTLWGTLFPILSEAVKGEKVNVASPYFNAVNGPLGLLLLALTGIGPLIAWRRSSARHLGRQLVFPVTSGLLVLLVLVVLGMRQWYALVSFTLAGLVMGTIVQEYATGIGARRRMYSESLVTAGLRLIGGNRRRYGGYIVHVGVVALFCAFAGLVFKKDVAATVRTGETVKAIDAYGSEWSFASQGISKFEELNRKVIAVTFSVTKDGAPMGLLSSQQRQYVDGEGEPVFEPTTEVGILASPKQDVYLVFVGSADKDTASIHLDFNPLVWWVWFGGIVMAFGGLVVMWPQVQLQVPLQNPLQSPLHAARGDDP